MPGGLDTAVQAGQRFASTRLEADGEVITTGAPVTAALALGETMVTAHGDGRLRLFPKTGGVQEVAAHDGAILSMAAEDTRAVLTGGDDGRFLHVSAEGEVEELAVFENTWVDCVAAHAVNGLVACSTGRLLHLWRPGKDLPQAFDHPSTVGGLAIDPTGRQVAVAHYGGVTVWDRWQDRWRSRHFAWAGSHIGVMWSPDSDYLVSVMQENALHAWRMSDKKSMQMVGYPAKPRACDWVGDVPHLATSGADHAICWPFDGRDGPAGRSPLMLTYGGTQRTTMVRALPGQPAVLAGFQDGAVLMGELDENVETTVVRGSTGVEVTGIAVTPSLSRILVGDARGSVLVAPLNG
jgi:WD40 repeat protein